MADKSRPEKDEERPATCWHDGRPEELLSVVMKCEQALSSRRFIEGCINRAYDGEPMIPTSGHATSYLDASTYLTELEALVKENHLRSVIGAAGSMIVRKAGYRAITAGGSHKRQMSARKVSRLLNGVAHVSGFNGLVEDVWIDSTLSVVAWALWNVEKLEGGGRVEGERVPGYEMSWNPAEGQNPRSVFRRTGVPLRALARRHKDLAFDIESSAPRYRPPLEFFLDYYPNQIDADMREVCIGWRKADGKDDPGRVVMTTGNIMLVDKEWQHDFWPAVPLKWSNSRSNTFAGVPLAFELLSGQANLNRMSELIDQALTLCGRPKVMAPIGSVDFSNAIEVIPFRPGMGKPEVISPPQVLPPETYRERDRQEASMYQRAGISQAVAQGTRPAGINSAVGQREHRDQASTRLVLKAQTLEAWQGENMRVAFALMAAAYGDKATRIKAPNTRLLNQVDWEALDLAENEIECRAYLTSAIPLEPAGRMERLAEWVAAGEITQRRATRWYANPDIEAIEDQEAAMEDLCLKLIEARIFDGNGELHPERVMGQEGLALLVDLAGKRLMEALVMEEPPPEANTELLRRLIEEAEMLMQPPPAPPGATPPAAPPMPPGPPVQEETPPAPPVAQA